MLPTALHLLLVKMVEKRSGGRATSYKALLNNLLGKGGGVVLNVYDVGGCGTLYILILSILFLSSKLPA